MKPMLAGAVQYVIGVDTLRDSHTAAVVEAATGAVVDHLMVPADAFGDRHLVAFADAQTDGQRVWAIEGTGSYGAGLTTALLEHGEWVVEIDRPARPARREDAKSDDLDAVPAAREALARQHLAAPRARGDREALRVLTAARHGAVVARTKAIGQLKALMSTRPSRFGINYAAVPPTSNSTAAHVFGHCQPTRSSTGRRFARSVAPRGAHSRWRLGPPTTRPNWSTSSWPSARSCSTSPASAPSPPRSF